MEKINAVITGIGGYVPDYVLNNDELSRMVDTNDEWIMTRVGIKERRILNEEGLGTSYMARKAAKQLLRKTGVDPDTIDALIVTTSTADYQFDFFTGLYYGPRSGFLFKDNIFFICRIGIPELNSGIKLFCLQFKDCNRNIFSHNIRDKNLFFSSYGNKKNNEGCNPH